MASLLSFDNPVFGHFALNTGIIVAKTVSMSVLTACVRVGRNVYANPEDLSLSKQKDLKVNFSDPVTERIRRCHTNDVENVFPFVLLGGMYVLTDPDTQTAVWCFRLFTCFRLAHTICYLGALPQPGRFLSALGGWGINLFMAYSVVMKASL